MPQPLSKVCSEGDIWFSARALRQSSFASDVAYTIATWAHIDGNIATIVSKMMKSDVATGAAMYASLVGGAAKDAALLACAKSSLENWHFLLLQAVLVATKASKDERNKFAHQIWGICPVLDDAMLLTPFTTLLASNVLRRQKFEVRSDGSGVIRPTEIDRSKVAVYRKADFANAVDEADKADHLFILFYATLDALSSEAAQQQLIEHSDIQKALSGKRLKAASEAEPKLAAHSR